MNILLRFLRRAVDGDGGEWHFCSDESRSERLTPRQDKEARKQETFSVSFHSDCRLEPIPQGSTWPRQSIFPCSPFKCFKSFFLLRLPSSVVCSCQLARCVSKHPSGNFCRGKPFLTKESASSSMAKKQHFDNETGGWVARFSAHEVHEDASELRVETLLSRFSASFFHLISPRAPFWILPCRVQLRSVVQIVIISPLKHLMLSLDSSKSYLLDGSFFLRKEK